MVFVLDNSVVTAWYVGNQATPYADAVAELLKDERAAVPALWELELANVLRTMCLRQAINAQEAQDILAQILAMPIEVDRQSSPPAELLGLALRYGLTSYDAAYLDLALRLQAPLATQDAPLRDAATAAGVGWLRL